MRFFGLSVSYMSSPIMQVESMKRQGRFSIEIDSIGDLRRPIALRMVETWRVCPERMQVVPTLVGPLLELTLVPVREIRQTILPLLIGMMDAEQKTKGSFKQMETELIDKLDILINENKGDDEYLQVFNNLMINLVQHIDPIWEDTGTVERLLEYRDVLQDDQNKAREWPAK